MPRKKVLIVDDEPGMCEFLAVALERLGYEPTAFCDPTEAISTEPFDFDAALVDVRMPRMDGLTCLAGLRSRRREMPIIVMTAYASVETAVEAMRRGAYDYLAKPFKIEELGLVLSRAVGGGRKTQLEMVGSSPAMRRLRECIARVGPTQSTVLLLGESGTGKELAARAIHACSLRSAGPFVAVDCGALPETLLESELFGHVKGAFTGAVGDKKGLFEVASGGTLFLDEVGEMSLGLQAKLLRTLQEREVRPVGGTKSVPVDVRVVAATNADLERLVREGAFREDLYFRLSVIPVRIPPLRERGEDIRILAEHFLRTFAAELGKRVCGFQEDALRALETYSWPGNVRELENAIERATVLATGEFITLEDLPEKLRGPASRLQSLTLPEGMSLKETVEDLERTLILRALEECGWNQRRAAKRLGVSRQNLQYKMKKYGFTSASGREGRR